MTDEPVISDPLAKFYEEADAQTAGVKDPITGIRVDVDVAKNLKNKSEEIKRKSQVAARVETDILFDELKREWMYDFLTTCHVFDIPLIPLSDFHSGMLSVGLQLVANLKRTNIRMYNLMIQEGYEREQMWAEMAADK